MEVVNIKNPSIEIVDEIRSWLEDYGYWQHHVFVVDTVSIYVSQKISDEDIIRFNEKFQSDLSIQGASYDLHGNLTEIKYVCDCRLLKKFRDYLDDWLINNDFSFRFFIITNFIKIFCFNELSMEQITMFEEEFDVECQYYSKSCDSNRITYKFS